MGENVLDVLNDDFTYLFNTGKNYHAYRAMGAHQENGGVRFTVWAPGVKSIHVIGEFNDWIGPYLAAGDRDGSVELDDVADDQNPTGAMNDQNPDGAADDPYRMTEIGTTGIWTCFVPNARAWQLYKYDIEYTEQIKIPVSAKQTTAEKAPAGKTVAEETPAEKTVTKAVMKEESRHILKADPFAFSAESRPGTASRIADMTYEWHDAEWMDQRAKHDTFRSPMNTYEMHLGSWRRHEDGTFLTYVELADILPEYLKDMGYTHVEFMPLMEHPFDSSWGYQVTGYYAPTSRYGSPGDLRYLIDRCHQAGIGVILDWVPGHFCMDDHGLGRFNGSRLFESGEHPEWGTYKFDFARPQVRSFLLSNALYWIEEYHADGLRVDSVTSMLYLNYGVTDEHKKKYNMFGDERDLDAMEFLKEFNYMVGTRCPGVFTVAEESTSWSKVTMPPDAGGLGFHYKWNMAWMHDALGYMQTDFQNRMYEHDRLAAQSESAYNENYVLSLSHDEVVHGKKSLISKMPGDIWRQFAGNRLLNLYQMTHPGKKLNFMGHELAEFIEWRDYEGLEWFMLDHENHRKYKEFIRDINHLYLEHPALWDNDSDWRGFRWIDAKNSKQQIFTFIRKSLSTGETLVVVLNASVKPYECFRIGVPEPGLYKEIINSDDERYAGSGMVNGVRSHSGKDSSTNERNSFPFIETESRPSHGMPYSITIKVPPLGGCILQKE